MRTAAIKKAALKYHHNRTTLGAEWEKEPDQQALFDAMKAAGLKGVSALGGTHMGADEKGRVFVVDIGDSVVFERYKDIKTLYKVMTSPLKEQSKDWKVISTWFIPREGDLA